MVSANSLDAWRIQRLANVTTYLEATGGIPRHLLRLHNHSARLIVCWDQTPSEKEKLRIFLGWQMQEESAVYHVFGAEPYTTPFDVRFDD